MSELLTCVICGEEKDETFFAKYYENERICSICDREMFEDSIGYEEE